MIKWIRKKKIKQWEISNDWIGEKKIKGLRKKIEKGMKGEILNDREKSEKNNIRIRKKKAKK